MFYMHEDKTVRICGVCVRHYFCAEFYRRVRRRQFDAMSPLMRYAARAAVLPRAYPPRCYLRRFTAYAAYHDDVAYARYAGTRWQRAVVHALYRHAFR